MLLVNNVFWLKNGLLHKILREKKSAFEFGFRNYCKNIHLEVRIVLLLKFKFLCAQSEFPEDHAAWCWFLILTRFLLCFKISLKLATYIKLPYFISLYVNISRYTDKYKIEMIYLFRWGIIPQPFPNTG